jgi:pimeloyl-ACP methyl ester carboxylesterase
MRFPFRSTVVRNLLVALSLLFVIPASADGPADNNADSVRPIPPPGIELDPAVVDELTRRCRTIRESWAKRLRQADAELQSAKRWQRAAARQARQTLHSLTPEILVFPRAVEMALEINQFYRSSEVDTARALLDEADARIARTRDGLLWSRVVGLGDGSQRQLLVGGYESKLDGSYQPYAVVIPPGLQHGDSRPRRLDIWFHGRGEKLSELSFLDGGRKNPGRYTPTDTFVLHPYGRYSNAFKFAGEVDVLEALDYVRGRLPVNPQRVSVRGFSMGGAACWQFATHYADLFFAANPGAGFSETPEFLKSFQGEDLSSTPEYQRTLWKLYDCPPWARNLVHCPTVAYSGELDRQKQAADVMQAALAEHGIDLVHMIGPETAHTIDANSKVEIERRMDSIAATLEIETPESIDFTTYTLRYHRMHWVDVRGLERHWQRATVRASADDDGVISVSTDNVTALRLDFQPGQWDGTLPCRMTIEIDGDELSAGDVASDRSFRVDLAKRGGQWLVVDRFADGLRKRPGIQGPIDDAFMDSFVFVLPTGKSADVVFQRWTEAESKHAREHWRKHFRGDIRTVDDRDLTKDQIREHNLILFGDTESNSVIARLAGGLPVRWTDEQIELGDQRFPRDGHAVAMVYPNPLQPDRYIVLNSGFTFREYDYLNNARQTPKLPDWAVIDISRGANSRTPGNIIAADFFDEAWQP